MPALSWTIPRGSDDRSNALSKRYGRLMAVDGISFKAEPGEVLGFLGPNGAGKSTTMKTHRRLPVAKRRHARASAGTMCRTIRWPRDAPWATCRKALPPTAR